MPQQIMRAVEIDSNEHIYRSTISPDKLVDSPVLPRLGDGEKTLPKLWEFVAEKWDNKNCLGWRELINIHTIEKPADPSDPESKPKKWSSYELSDYKWMSYRDAKRQTDRIAVSLKEMGVRPGDRLLMFAKTSADWLLMSYASFTNSVIIATAYDSMPVDAVLHTLTETEAVAIFTETSLADVVSQLVERAPKGQVRVVVYAGHESEGAEGTKKLLAQQKEKDFKAVHIDELKHREIDESALKDMVEPRTGDTACIMYTSGSTGTPKGAELTHGNLVATISSAEMLIDNQLEEDDIIIAYLPQAHVLEFLVENMFVFVGIPIGFGRVRTLLGGESVVGPGGEGAGVGDLKALRPTLMAGVPTVWERIRKGMLAQVAKKGWFAHTVFTAAVSFKWWVLNLYGRESFWSRLIDRTVLAPVKEVTGGRIRIGLTGGAPISKETHRFMYSTLGYLLSGYGLTEISGLGSITLPQMGYRLNTIGAPGPSTEIKLVTVEDTEYHAEDGQGEIWLRGPSVMKGYYKQPDLTREALTEDGWFRSGDIAKWNPDGTISIMDRVKNLVKLSNGEYVALEQLESRYRDSVKVKNLCLLAQGGKDFILGVVEPTDDKISKEDLLNDLKAIARKTGCSKSETVRNIVVTRGEDWMTNGFLTTSGKLKRRDIEHRFKKEIDEMYKQE